MSGLKKFLVVILGAQMFIIVPWFLGAIARREQSLWVWQEYSVDLARHGRGDAMLLGYLYLIFYLSLFLIPYAILGLRYPGSEPFAGKLFRESRALFSLWLSGSFLLLAHPIFDFLGSLPIDIWNGWFMILWAASGVGLIYLVIHLEKIVRARASKHMRSL